MNNNNIVKLVGEDMVYSKLLPPEFNILQAPSAIVWNSDYVIFVPEKGFLTHLEVNLETKEVTPKCTELKTDATKIKGAHLHGYILTLGYAISIRRN